MIVRNEAAIIEETLDNIAPYIGSWVIVDTGSDDGTPDVIRDHMARRGIPGELHERPWRNFGHNRSEALTLAQAHGDYIWVLDADDKVVGNLDFGQLRHTVRAYESQTRAIMDALHEAVDEGAVSAGSLKSINAMLRALENSWLDRAGLHDRPWFRNIYAAPDPTDGYQAWMLPVLRRAVEQQRANFVVEAQQPYLDAFHTLREKMGLIEAVRRQLDEVLRRRGLKP